MKCPLLNEGLNGAQEYRMQLAVRDEYLADGSSYGFCYRLDSYEL